MEVWVIIKNLSLKVNFDLSATGNCFQFWWELVHGLGLYIFEVNEPHNSVVVGIADKQEQLPAVCSSAPLPGIFVRLNWQFAFNHS